MVRIKVTINSTEVYEKETFFAENDFTGALAYIQEYMLKDDNSSCGIEYDFSETENETGNTCDIDKSPEGYL